MIIQGRDILVYDQSGDNLVACSRSCEIKTSTEMIEISSPRSGKWKEYIDGRSEWSIDINHFLSTEDGASLKNLLRTGSEVVVRVARRDDGVKLAGMAYVKSAQVTATTGNISQGSLSLIGNGELSEGVNLFPSITSGWEGYECGSVIYTSDLGIQDNQTSDLYSPAVWLLKGSHVCFSAQEATPGTFPASMYYCYITTNFNYLSDIYDNGTPVQKEFASKTIGNVVRKYTSFIMPEDAWLCINIANNVEVVKPQLEYGDEPTAFQEPFG